jgi:hypothetical protein
LATLLIGITPNVDNDPIHDDEAFCEDDDQVSIQMMPFVVRGPGPTRAIRMLHEDARPIRTRIGQSGDHYVGDFVLQRWRWANLEQTYVCGQTPKSISNFKL